MHDQYEVDLADMQKLKDKNDGVQFLLVVIDVFMRYVWVEALKTKSELDVIQGFKNNFYTLEILRRLYTERGGEFTRQKVEDYFNSINVEHWSVHNDEMKANYAKCIIYTFKTSIWGFKRHPKNRDMWMCCNNWLSLTMTLKTDLWI